MKSKLVLVTISTALLSAVVSANSGPAPLPKGHKVAEPPVRFEGIDKHPDYVFHMSYAGPYLPMTVIEVKDTKSIKLQFRWKDRTPGVTYMAIMAMERKEFERRKKEYPDLKWLENPMTTGLLVAKLTPPETTVPIVAKEVPMTTYKVTLKDGKLSAEKVAEVKGGGLMTEALPAWPVGLLTSLSIAWFGLWFVRRDGNRKVG